MTREEFGIEVDKLEAMGLLRKTGEFEPNRAGVLEPVYAAMPDDELTMEARLAKMSLSQDDAQA